MEDSERTLRRWLMFSAVGLVGAGVQTAVLVSLVRGAGLNYLVATVLAVEAAVIHNFVWHLRWTWADRSKPSPLTALWRFNLSTGAVSILGNLVVMRALVGGFGLGILSATLTTLAICSVLNFVISDRCVFV